MLDFDRSPWIKIEDDLSLFRYSSRPTRRVSVPILLLHGPMTSHRTWDTLATYLSVNGLDTIYATDIDEGALQKENLSFLNDVVEWLLEQHQQQLVLIGHSTGGVLARRYLHRGNHSSEIIYLFSLASPHQQTYFSHIVYVPSEEPIPATSYVRTPDIPQKTFMINIFGSKIRADFDGTIRGVYLPEAVNYSVNVGHSEIKHHGSVMAEILACLRGERYRVQLHLDSLTMKTADVDGRVGPFYFEVEGSRSPFDGVFQAVVDHHYQFDDNNTPLFTLAYPTTQTACSLVFRLKDKSRVRPVRRRLFTRILVALDEQKTVIHEMQDSEGSKIALRICCERMPALVEGL